MEGLYDPPKTMMNKLSMINDYTNYTIFQLITKINFNIIITV